MDWPIVAEHKICRNNNYYNIKMYLRFWQRSYSSKIFLILKPVLPFVDCYTNMLGLIGFFFRANIHVPFVKINFTRYDLHQYSEITSYLAQMFKIIVSTYLSSSGSRSTSWKIKHVNPVSIRFDSTNPTFINDALKIKIGIYWENY